MFSLEESLRLMLLRPSIARNLSYEHVPDCDEFHQVMTSFTDSIDPY